MKIVRFSELQFMPSAHEDPADPGVLIKILFNKDDFIDGKAQMINWAKLPKGKSFRAHYHQDMQEVFILLNGKAKISIDTEADVLNRGDAVIVPVCKVHKMANIGTDDVEYLVVGISERKGGKTVVV